MIGLRELLRRWCDAAAPIEAPDHAPCAWADTALPDRLALDREARRRELEHAIAIEAAASAIEAAASAIECHCRHSHTEADGRDWYACDPRTRADLSDEIEYLTLCGLLDIIHGDVMLVRIRTELLP